MDAGVKKYFAAVPEGRRARIEALHELIVGLFPDVHIDMKYKMPTYRSGDGWVAIANQKDYVSLYTCGYHHIEAFKMNNPEIKTGKGCLNFRDRDELPLADIKRVVKHAITRPKPRSP